MRILIVAGGTGGHFYPGLAVAREASSSGHEVQFAVRADDKVIPLLDREKISYGTIRASGLTRKISTRLFNELRMNAAGIKDALFLLLRVRPDVVLAMGGYLSFPVGLAAWIYRCPLLLHEQNVVPGLANRFLSRFATHVAVSFQASRRAFKGPVTLTGNPIRPEFKNLPDRISALREWGLDPNKKTLLVFGGSLGAHRLNELILAGLKNSTFLNSVWQVLHFSGEKDHAWLKREYATLPFQHVVEAYCHEMPRAYAASEVVICRAGASTISELIAVHKPALLVPYPHATDNHQAANAAVLVEAGVALMEDESALTEEKMADVLAQFLDPRTLSHMDSQFMKLELDFFSSARRVCDVLVNLKNKS